MSRIVRLKRAGFDALLGFVSARSGGIALIFALVVGPVLAVGVLGAIDVSEQLTARSRLQDATDAAALAVSATDAETPTTSEATLKTDAGNMLAANFKPYTGSGGTPTITQFTLCTTNQPADCGTGAVTNTVKISTQVRAPCWAPLIMPGLCTSDGQSMLLTATNVTTVGLPSAIQMSLVLDVSGSMIVGATPSDVQAVINWNNNSAHWASVGDSGATTPCAFACHDDGNGSNHPTTSGYAGSDMDQGLTNAHAAGSTTRYDVMISAASSAIKYIQNQVTANSQLAKNSYFFNIYALADNLTQAWSASSAQPNDWNDAAAAVNKTNLPVGLDTHFSTALQPLTTSAWTGGTGASYASPRKVVFLVTDGLQSDFFSDFNNPSLGVDSAWASQASASPGWSGYYVNNEYAQPISTSLCTAIKNNGITLAVLETPYVPLPTQDPKEYGYEFFPWENFVRHVIYPGGPNTASTVSAALQACASDPTLYQQASSTDSTSISTGLQRLVNAYLATNAFLKQ